MNYLPVANAIQMRVPGYPPRAELDNSDRVSKKTRGPFTANLEHDSNIR